MQLSRSEDRTEADPPGEPAPAPPGPDWYHGFFGSSWELHETANFRLLVVALPKTLERDYLAALRRAVVAYAFDAHHAEIVRGVIDGAASLAKANLQPDPEPGE